jgi:hypothetical protein
LHCSTVEKGKFLLAKVKEVKALNRSRRIEIRLSDEELKIITDKAEAHGLNTSTYLRSLAMNYPVKSLVDRQAVSALLKVNGDLGKLGGLFKLWMTRNSDDRDDFSGNRTYKDIDILVDDIEHLAKSIRNEAMLIMEKM